MKLRRNLTALVLGLSTIAAFAQTDGTRPYLTRTGLCKYKLVLRILWEKLNSET